MPDGRANNGGARPGAGRPRAEATVLREILIKKMEEQAEPIAEALIAKALERDVPAIKEILDRGLGKALAQVDVTSNGESINEKLVTLEDDQLDKLIVSLKDGRADSQGGSGGSPIGEAQEDKGESA